MPLGAHVKLFQHSEKLQMPTTNKDTEASSRVSGDSQQKHILWVTILQLPESQTFRSILLYSSSDFNSFFFFQLASSLSTPWPSSVLVRFCHHYASNFLNSCTDSQLSFLFSPMDSSPFIFLHLQSCFKCKQIAMISTFNQNQEIFMQLELKEQNVFQQETLQESFMSS